MEEFKLSSIEDAVKDFREGKFVIVVDDEDRENEGDLICAAEKITPEMVNFMLKNARGVLCVPITMSRCEELNLPRQVNENTSMLGTPFTVTVDKLEGCTTGVSIHDRAATIRALADPASKPETFGRPGHINPLYAQENGVLKRSGHTEAAIDLCRMAGLYPAGALMEIMNDDGSMARMPQLIPFAQKHGLKIISIKDMIAYRLRKDSLVDMGEEVDMPTAYGHFRMIPFRQLSNGLSTISRDICHSYTMTTRRLNINHIVTRCTYAYILQIWKPIKCFLIKNYFVGINYLCITYMFILILFSSISIYLCLHY